MNKLLLASTALVASTTFAMANDKLTISGEAEMGVFGSDGTFNGTEVDVPLQFHTDVNVKFAFESMTDNGLTFGAEIELGDAIAGGSATDNDADDGGVVIYVKGAFGNLTMGDTDGAYDFAVQEASIIGGIRDDQEHAGWYGNDLDGDFGLDGQVARYDYTFGDFSFAVSAEVTNVDMPAVGTGEHSLGIGGKYAGSFGGADVTFGVGYQEVSRAGAADTSVIGFSVDVETANGFRAILAYSDFDEGIFTSPALLVPPLAATYEVEDHVGIALGYEVGAIAVAFNYGQFDIVGGDIDGYALVANYDLGGGAVLKASYGASEWDFGGGVTAENDTYSFGLAMSF